ncbi:MAG: tyrosine recombinase XerC [Oscillospiraceae bacterium]|nr:tyrosine recombinase XerC [Oscillospiraceae bacterium]
MSNINNISIECPYYINEYVTYLRVIKGSSERTVQAYYGDICLFLKYIKMTKLSVPSDTLFEDIIISDIPIETLDNLSLTDIYGFLNYVSKDRENSSVTRARKASALRSLFKYLTTKTSYIKKNPVKDLEMPSLKKRLPHFLTLEQSLEMLKNSSSGDNSERDYCIITLFLNCGMRLSELVGMNIQSINFKDRTLKLLGKGNKERMIYLNDACIDALKKYINSREQPQNEPNALFISRNGKRISKRRVQQIVEDTLKASGLDGQGLSTHKLRHTAATLMYRNGVDTLVLKDLLGHESIATTEIYTHISDENLKQAAESSPLSRVIMNKKPEED